MWNRSAHLLRGRGGEQDYVTRTWDLEGRGTQGHGEFGVTDAWEGCSV